MLEVKLRSSLDTGDTHTNHGYVDHLPKPDTSSLGPHFYEKIVQGELLYEYVVMSIPHNWSQQ